jgi:CSLREA domain-containing protein
LRRRPGICGVAGALALLLTPAAALGQELPPREIVVNDRFDDGDGTCNASECTLREAIAAARPIDTVRVPADLYILTQGDLFLAADRVVGAGARSTIIDGNGKRRVLTVNSAGTTATSTVTGVTIRNGNGTSESPNGGNNIGGGIYVQSGNLTLNNSHVIGNSATVTGIGGGIALAGGNTLTMIGSTVAGNTASGRGARGGGIGVSGENAGIALGNSTITGNVAVGVPGSPSTGGGIFAGLTPRLLLINVTIANNQASPGGGGGVAFLGNANAQVSGMNNTILAGNIDGACPQGVGLPGVPTHHNLVQDSTCALSGTADVQGVNASLLPLTNNGGPTDTRALPAGSAAIDRGGSCAQTDQRGITRPPSACDIGAFEYVAPTLTVTTTLVNDNGGTATAVTYRVTRNGADVAGSPASSNATFTLEPATFNVSAGLAGYTVTIGGDCSPAGDVVLAENQTRACTIVANDNAVVGGQLPPPVLRKSVTMIPTRGTIKVKRPGARRFTTLADDGAQLPVGTTVDARNGRVRIVAAIDQQGGTDTAIFYAGIFKIAQTKGTKPTTVLTLTEKLSCPKAGSAIAAAKKKRKRRLWGDGSGRFRTKGKHSAATVVGTKWLVEDRCTSTLTRVVRGKVSVRDFVKKKTITLRKGKRYIARAKKR